MGPGGECRPALFALVLVEPDVLARCNDLTEKVLEIGYVVKYNSRS